jgi:hypothetical protein
VSLSLYKYFQKATRSFLVLMEKPAGLFIRGASQKDSEDKLYHMAHKREKTRGRGRMGQHLDSF